MTANKRFKRLVRERATKTGESYTAARRHFALPERGQEMPTINFQPVGFDDVEWSLVTELTIVPFLQDDGRLVLVRDDEGGRGRVGGGGERGGERVRLPSGAVREGEDPFIDTALRLPLEVAGFRRQQTLVVGRADAAHVALWCDGYRYDGERAHATVEWWTGDAAAGAAVLRAQGDDGLARLVTMADEARRSLSDDDFFSANLRLLETSYLDPRHSNPRQGSGFGGSEDDWFARRHHVIDAIDRDGSFIDVGCANGLLAENVVAWAAERGFRVDPYGVDLSARLVDEAARRLPQWADHFFTGNSVDWTAPGGRRFDVVHTLLELVPTDRRAELVTHLRDRVARPGGRVVFSHYVPIEREDQWPRAVLEGLGFEVAGETTPDRSAPRPVPPSAWIRSPG